MHLGRRCSAVIAMGLAAFACSSFTSAPSGTTDAGAPPLDAAADSTSVTDADVGDAAATDGGPFVRATSKGVPAGTSITVSRPNGTAANDLLVLFVSADSYQAFDVTSFATPLKVQTFCNNTNRDRILVATRRDDGTASFTFSLPSDGDTAMAASAILVAVAGAADALTLDDFASADDNGNAGDAPSVSVHAARDLVLAAFATASPSGFPSELGPVPIPLLERTSTMLLRGAELPSGETGPIASGVAATPCWGAITVSIAPPP